MNRIDSRARGNAPQLLEKYKKLAHDAHLNGDRVQEEYYLQFADHYFRVIADQRQRQEEARQPRRDDRSPDYGDYVDDEGDGEVARPYQDRAYQERSYQERSYQERSHQERGPTGDRGFRGNAEGRGAEGRGAEGRGAEGGGSEGRTADERGAEERSEPVETKDENVPEAERSIYEPAENPFVRDGRNARGGLKQRRPRRDRDEGRDEGEEPNGNVAVPVETASSREEAAGGFDPAVLPPAISAKAEEKPKRRPRAKAKAEDGEETAEKPRARRRTRKADSSTDGADDGALETIG